MKKFILILSITAIFSCNKTSENPSRDGVDMVGSWTKPIFEWDPVQNKIAKTSDVLINFDTSNNFLIVNDEFPFSIYRMYNYGQWRYNNDTKIVDFIDVVKDTNNDMANLFIGYRKIWWDITYYSHDSIHFFENIKQMDNGRIPVKDTGLVHRWERYLKRLD